MLALGPANIDEAGVVGEEPGTLTFKFGVIPTADKEKSFFWISFLLVACGSASRVDEAELRFQARTEGEIFAHKLRQFLQSIGCDA